MLPEYTYAQSLFWHSWLVQRWRWDSLTEEHEWLQPPSSCYHCCFSEPPGWGSEQLGEMRMTTPHSVQQKSFAYGNPWSLQFCSPQIRVRCEFTDLNAVCSHFCGDTRVKWLQRSWGVGRGVHFRPGPQGSFVFSQITYCLEETVGVSFASYFWLFRNVFQVFLRWLIC